MKLVKTIAVLLFLVLSTPILVSFISTVNENDLEFMVCEPSNEKETDSKEEIDDMMEGSYSGKSICAVLKLKKHSDTFLNQCCTSHYTDITTPPPESV